MISWMSNTNGSITLFLYNNIHIPLGPFWRVVQSRLTDGLQKGELCR